MVSFGCFFIKSVESVDLPAPGLPTKPIMVYALDLWVKEIMRSLATSREFI